MSRIQHQTEWIKRRKKLNLYIQEEITEYNLKETLCECARDMFNIIQYISIHTLMCTIFVYIFSSIHFIFCPFLLFQIYLLSFGCYDNSKDECVFVFVFRSNEYFLDLKGISEE